jgi:hypothetical protein
MDLKVIINYYLLLIKETAHSYIMYVMFGYNILKRLFFTNFCFVVFCKKNAKVIIL